MPTNTYENLQQLVGDFWTWRAANQPISSDDIPRIERPDDWVLDWSRDAIARRRGELSEFAARHEAIDARSWPVPQQVDYRLIASAIARVHWELNISRGQESNPGFYVDQTLGLLFLSLLKPPPFTGGRGRGNVRYLENFPSTDANAKEKIPRKAIRPFSPAAPLKAGSPKASMT